MVSFLSADGKTTLHGVIWLPEGAVRGVIQVVHGITEHMGRYDDLARYFTARGYAVAGHDQIGHGKSVGPEGLPMYFGPRGSWDYLLQDAGTFAGLLAERFPGVPRCLLGFSLGSFVVRCLMGSRPELADLTVWAGTGYTSAAERAMAGAIVRLEEHRFGDRTETPLLRKLTMDTYNQKFKPCRTDADWLCANPAAVDAYLADPLCGRGFTVGSFRELLTGMAISGSSACFAGMDGAMPVLLLSGSDDPVGNFGKGMAKVESLLRKQGVRDVTARLFPAMRHDIFHEKESITVFETIADWLETRI